MISRKTLAYVICAILMGLLAGCSSSAPTTPETSSTSIDYSPIIAASGDNFYDAVGILGAYDLTINPENLTAELTLKRSAALHESYIINGTDSFTIAPCTNCLKIKWIAKTLEHNIQLIFYVKHPFLPGDPTKPPTGKNRLDLDVFDPVLIIRPTNVPPRYFEQTGTYIYDRIIVNNAGYTTELSNVIDDSTALPYVLVIDDNAAGTNTWNKFSMGAEYGEDDLVVEDGIDVIFDLPVITSVTFEIYMTFGYGASAKKSQRLHPTYFNPEFNRKSAWKVVVTPPNGNDSPDFYNTWCADSSDPRLFYVKVEVFDWQINAHVDPALLLPTDVYASSEVANVSLEIPGLFDSLHVSTTPESGTGAPDDPLVYRFCTGNPKPLGVGEYISLVKVNDERDPGKVILGGETDTLGDAPTGRDINWYEMPEFATYQTFIATVVEAPSFTITSPSGGEKWSVGSEHEITWSGGDILPYVMLFYSIDDFATDSHDIDPNPVINNGTYLWTIPDSVSDTVKVRVFGVGPDFVRHSWVDDESEYFSITQPLLERIVYLDQGICSVDPDGGNYEQWPIGMTEIFGPLNPKLSPDGDKILYTVGSGYWPNAIYYMRILDILTLEDKIIHPTGYDVCIGDFQHSGHKIVASAGNYNESTTMDLYTMNYDGTELERLTYDGNNWYPEYIWDDSKIVYVHRIDIADEIFIYDVQSGASQYTYTSYSGYKGDPHFSPDGTKIAFATRPFAPDMYNQIYVSPVTSWYPPDFVITGEPLNLGALDPCFNPEGAYPEGTKIVYRLATGIIWEWELYVYDIETGESEDLIPTPSPLAQGYPDWGYMIEH